MKKLYSNSLKAIIDLLNEFIIEKQKSKIIIFFESELNVTDK